MTDVQPWQRPPFAKGNEVALKHGAFSPRVRARVSEEAAEMVDALQAAGCMWIEQADSTSVTAWSFAEIQTDRLRAYLEDVDDVASDEFKRISDLVLAWERRRDAAAKALGLSPLARAQLGRDVAIAKGLARDVLKDTIERGRPL